MVNEYDFYNDIQKKVLVDIGLDTNNTLEFMNRLLKLYDSKEKTVYIVTRCACEENYTPQAFKKFEDAYSYMKKAFDKEKDSFSDNIETTTLSKTKAYIQYKNDSYDRWEIFTVLIN